MTTLKVGIATYEEMKARTMAVARGERRVSPDEPRVWFTSTESFAKVLSAGNRELLRVISEKAPGSLDELARITGKAKSNLSRTLRTMEGYGLIRLERGERGRITPKVMHDRVELDLPLTLHGPEGERLVGFDNAHPVGRQKRGEPRDHRHRALDDQGLRVSGRGDIARRLLGTVAAVLRERGVIS